MAIPTTNKIVGTFVPIYDNRTNEFNTLYCRPSMTDSDGKTLSDETLLGLGTDGRSIKEKIVLPNMMGTLAAAFHKAQDLIYDGDKTKIIVPINGGALYNREIANEFTQACRSQSEEIRNSLIFEVTNMSDNLNQSLLDEIAVILHLFCLTYICRVSPRNKDYHLYATCNYSGISFSLFNLEFPIEKLGPILEKIITKTEASRLKAYMHGVKTPEIRDSAIAAGFRFVGGEAVQPELMG